MRGILKRASVVCHPESGPQKTLVLDTEQDSTPFLTEGRQVQVLDPASPQALTGAGDVRREVRTGPMRDVTRASSSDDIGDDVVMREDNADEHRADHPSSSGSDSKRRITTKREPCKARDPQTSATEQHEQHVPRRISGKQWLPEQSVAVTTQTKTKVLSQNVDASCLDGCFLCLTWARLSLWGLSCTYCGEERAPPPHVLPWRTAQSQAARLCGHLHTPPQAEQFLLIVVHEFPMLSCT